MGAWGTLRAYLLQHHGSLQTARHFKIINEIYKCSLFNILYNFNISHLIICVDRIQFSVHIYFWNNKHTAFWQHFSKYLHCGEFFCNFGVSQAIQNHFWMFWKLPFNPEMLQNDVWNWKKNNNNKSIIFLTFVTFSTSLFF